ncbi:MAG: tyrosine-type recombinase/integrase [Planktothrix sp. GU0601_MAG3]|nr:MAG: tyrosine-type recombinase/integrase [Planktothrix sp. GU0601_MAG3]
MRVSVGADKKWLRLRWKDGQGKYKILYPGCENNSEGSRTAQRIALQMEEDFEKGNFDYSLSKYKVQASKVNNAKTFEDIYKQWINMTKKHLSGRTIQAYRCHANSVESLNILSMKPELITSNEVYSIIAFLQKCNKPKVIKLKMTIFSSAWDWGKKNGLISTENPFKEVNIESSRSPEIDPFSREEVRKILEFAPSDKKPFIKFLFLTGCRLGEAVGLRWDDLSPNCQNVKISRQFTGGEFKPLKKGGKPRSFCLPTNFADELMELKSESNHDLVFGESGETYRSSHFSEDMDKNFGSGKSSL